MSDKIFCDLIKVAHEAADGESFMVPLEFIHARYSNRTGGGMTENKIGAMLLDLNSMSVGHAEYTSTPMEPHFTHVKVVKNVIAKSADPDPYTEIAQLADQVAFYRYQAAFYHAAAVKAAIPTEPEVEASLDMMDDYCKNEKSNEEKIHPSAQVFFQALRSRQQKPKKTMHPQGCICVTCEYSVTHAEQPPTDAHGQAALDALQRFKDYVHKRLDDAGIPTHPDGEHSKAGCRIGDRLDIALQSAAVPSWQPIETAPKDGTLFVCREKSKPHVQFEAAMFKESESWEMPQEYDVLHNLTTDEPIDGDYSHYEWTALLGGKEGV